MGRVYLAVLIAGLLVLFFTIDFKHKRQAHVNTKPAPNTESSAEKGPPPTVLPNSANPVDVKEAGDLRPWGIRGRIDLPAGANLSQNPKGGVTLTSNPNTENEFQLVIRKANDSLAQRKDSFGKKGTFKNIGTDGFIVEASEGNHRLPHLVLDLRCGAKTYRIESVGLKKSYSQEQIQQMVSIAKTLRQTEAMKQSEAKADAAIKAIQDSGGSVQERENDILIRLAGDRAQDGLLTNLREILGNLTVQFEKTKNITPQGIASLGNSRCRTVIIDSGLQNPGIVASLAKIGSLEKLGIHSYQPTTLNLELLADFKQLQAIEIIGDLSVKKPAPFDLAPLIQLPLLTSLHLESLPFSDENLAQLRSFSKLKKLSLIDCGITDSRLRLLDSLRELAEVDLRSNPIRGQGLSAFQGLEQLHSLRLDNTLVNDSGLQKLQGTPLVELSLVKTPVTNTGMKHLAGLQTLQNLWLDGTNVQGPGLAEIAGLKNLTELSLVGLDIPDASLEPLRGLSKLQILNVSHSPISDMGLSHVAALPKLQNLNLQSTFVTNAGIALFANHPTIETIHAQQTDVQETVREKFAGKVVALLISPSLQDAEVKTVVPPVAISELKPSDPVAMIKRLEGTIRWDETTPERPIVEVCLRGDKVTNLDLAELRDLKHLKRLNLDGCNKVTDAGLVYLANLPEIEELELTSSKFQGDGLVFLQKLSQLRRIDLPNVRYSPSQLAPLSKLNKLEYISFDIAQDSNRALAFLATLPNLKELDLSKVKMDLWKFRHLRNLARLERLILDSGTITNRALKELQNLPLLKELTLHSDDATDESLQVFSKCKELRELHLSGSRWTDQALVHFKDCEKLEKLNLSRFPMTDRGAVHLRPFTNLIEIDLSHTQIGDTTLDILGELRQLETVLIANTRITDMGLTKFKNLEELRWLRLDDTKVIGTGFWELQELPRLSKLEMDRCPVTASGLKAISKLQRLTRFYFDETPVTDTDLAPLKMLTSLQSVSLKHSPNLTDKAAEHLKAIPQLSDLWLQGTKLSDKAINEIRQSREGIEIRRD